MGRLRQVMAISVAATWQFSSRPQIIHGISDLKPLALWRCAWACACGCLSLKPGAQAHVLKTRA